MTAFARSLLVFLTVVLLIAVNVVLVWAVIINPDFNEPTKLAMIGFLLLVDAIAVAFCAAFPT